MKKLVIISALWVFSLLNVFSQSTFATNDWGIGGRYLGFNGTQPANTFLPFRTNNIIRMALNGNRNTSVNGQPNLNRNGFLGIGQNYGTINNWNDVAGNPAGGPLSLLHLNGYEGNTLGTLGFRNWMQSGITFTANNDIMYVGPRANALDITDAMFVWGDNSQTGFGPDNLLFAFTSGNGTGTDDLTGSTPNGREILRLTATGNVGLGPRFNNAAQPQSQFHINAENLVPVWLQLSSQNGTGQSATDGLRMGLNNAVGYIFNQENSHLIFSTNASTVTQLALERMRISHVGAPGIPATAANGSTRIAISLTPTSPLTAPRSLMHIGAPLSGQGGSTDGVRNWMNVGYLSTFDSDNMYVGLKNEGADRQDAVIAWGDNQTNLINGSGPDNLRFIFANSQFPLSPGTPEAKSDNGQEIGRFTPACATCPVNTGSFGIGNYSPSIIQNGNIVNNPNGPDSAGYIGATLDVNGDARIRTVQLDNSLNQVLVRDSNDLGRIYWRDAATLGGGTGLGNDCGAAPNPLLSDRQIPLANFDLYFTGQSLPSVGNTLNIGLNCGVLPLAKFNLLQNTGSPIPVNTTGSYFSNQDISTVIGNTYRGLYSEAIGIQEQNRINNIGGSFYATGAANNYGVRGDAFVPNNPPPTTGLNGFGGYFTSTGPGNGNNGVIAEAYGGRFQNTGIAANARSLSGDPTNYNAGGVFSAGGDAETNTGVLTYGLFPGNQTSLSKAFGLFATVGHTVPLYTPLPSSTAIAVYGGVVQPIPTGVPTFAGYFDGDVFINGPTNGTGFALVSDQQFKTDIQEIQNAGQLISQLQPKEYNFVNGENLGIDLPSEHQYGFIAQEVEAVLPEFVHNVIKPATVDSLGNIIKPKVEYKSLNYIGFIALLMQDAKEKEQKIAQMESNYLALSQQIAELSSKIDGCCNTPRNQQESYIVPTGAVIQTNLRNAEEPTLGQNIPNPFEYQTRIPLFLPNSISKAELIFYGNDGKILQNILVADRGTVQVEVNAEALAAGIYSYTLFVDGRPVDTKRMIKN